MDSLEAPGFDQQQYEGQKPKDGDTRIIECPCGPYHSITFQRYHKPTLRNAGGWKSDDRVDFLDPEIETGSASNPDNP